jgi:thymidylate synthase
MPDLRLFASRWIVGETLAEAWEESMRRLAAAEDTTLVSGSTAGDFIEWENVNLIAASPQRHPKVSDKYEFPELVADYTSYFNEQRDPNADFATITERLFAWPMSDGTALDQVALIKSELRTDPGSRRAMASVWNPAEDLAEGRPAPLGQCFFHFTIRDQALNLTVVSRSVDAWLGEVPNMVAFAELQRQVALELGYPMGPYHQFILSYHAYLTSMPMIKTRFQTKRNLTGSR